MNLETAVNNLKGTDYSALQREIEASAFTAMKADVVICNSGCVAK
jgi:hypothetical protein